MIILSSKPATVKYVIPHQPSRLHPSGRCLLFVDGQHRVGVGFARTLPGEDRGLPLAMWTHLQHGVGLKRVSGSRMGSRGGREVLGLPQILRLGQW